MLIGLRRQHNICRGLTLALPPSPNYDRPDATTCTVCYRINTLSSGDANLHLGFDETVGVSRGAICRVGRDLHASLMDDDRVVMSRANDPVTDSQYRTLTYNRGSRPIKSGLLCLDLIKMQMEALNGIISIGGFQFRSVHVIFF